MEQRSDPRPQAGVEAGDTRPIVASTQRPVGIWVFGAIAIVAALLLFSVLDARRRGLSAPVVRPRATDVALQPRSAPPLYVPPAPAFEADRGAVPLVRTVPDPAPTPAAIASPVPTPEPRPLIVPEPPPPVLPSPPTTESPRGEGTSANQGSPLVIDLGTPRAAASPPQGAEGGEGAAGSTGPSVAAASRVQAGRFRRRSTTIAQGTLIPAVLETALDSTRPGQARALVSRDVHGYGGSRLLIPRGSRLYGEYRADLAPGQNRAFVQWGRLVRPDGVTVMIDSPAADSLGRSGIRGRVNSHFFERFGSALLQTSLNIGTSVAASRIGNGSVIVALPTGALGAAPQIATQQIQPTLKVRQGTRISVFVARDLDFTAVERR